MIMATIGSMPSMATRDKKRRVIAAIEGLKTALGMTADNAI